ncbi:MAG: aminotransferase class V-fold PLP-dependent enzyme [Verrucomicrobiota bacterium]
MNLFPNEAERRELFPICKTKIYFAHAAVTMISAHAADAITRATEESASHHQEFTETLRLIKESRQTCAQFIGAHPDEIALLGPTSLGISLFANGLDWEAGDEVLCYQGDYPANVYPWLNLRRRGVVVNLLEPQALGEITPELIAAALTPKTKLVALASAHFFNGYRIDIEAIGKLLHDRGILFSLDAIQTLGAFPIDVEKAHVDFLSADAHKWMLGPLAIGIVYVRRCHFDRLRPTLLGAWNVVSPDFQAQEEIVFVPTAQRYEPGVLNVTGILGMTAALQFFLHLGMDKVSARILELKAYLVAKIQPLGFQIHGPIIGPNASGITTFHHPKVNSATLQTALDKAEVIVSVRQNREGLSCLRFSPHFYNTEEEIDLAVEVLRGSI